MKHTKILDCTLRDGGYINEWNFGENVIKDIIKKLIDSNTDLIEIGFLRDCKYDANKTLFNNCKEIQNILPKTRKKSKFTAMILHNLYDINKLEKFDGQSIDYLRITFHDYDIDEGLAYIEKAQNKGYKVFCNPINIMGYTDQQILTIIKKVNTIKPYAFSIVDTFGSMNKKDLIRIYSLCANNLNSNIMIGLHLHENLNSAFSLAQEFLSIIDTKRKHTIDASLFGMGRVPGNLCIELIANYLNEEFGLNYDIDYYLDAIDEHIAKLKKIEEWGYSIAYALSAKHNLHRNYSEFLLKKGRLTSKQINQILSQIKPEKKTAFDKEYIEKLYISYQSNLIDDKISIKKLKENFKDKKILLIASGSSIEKYKEKINDFIKQQNPLVISLNFNGANFKCDYHFFTNMKRFNFFKSQDKNDKYIITSNIKDENINLILNYHNLILNDDEIFDNCTLMFLKFLNHLGIKEVNIAGFDGFEQNKSYFDSSLNSNLNQKELELENYKIKNTLKNIKHNISLTFLTPSIYEDNFKGLKNV